MVSELERFLETVANDIEGLNLETMTEAGIDKLPLKHPPLAKLLAQRLGLHKGTPDGEAFEGVKEATGYVAQVQQELDLLIVNLLLAEDEAQQELIMAQVISDAP